MFSVGWLPSVRVTVVLALLLSVIGFFAVPVTAVAFLPRVALLAYVLPFTATIGYVFAADFTWWVTPNSVALMRTPFVIERMVLMGTVGLAGLLLGGRLAGQPGSPASRPPAPARNFSCPAFLLLVAAALGLSWLHAPAGTLRSGTYGDIVGSDVAASVNFNSAALLSYALLGLAAIDIERTSD